MRWFCNSCKHTWENGTIGKCSICGSTDIDNHNPKLRLMKGETNEKIEIAIGVAKREMEELQLEYKRLIGIQNRVKDLEKFIELGELLRHHIE